LSLAERLRAGSQTAWQDLVQLYGPLVDRWARSANVPPDAVPDIAQEVFMAAFRGLDRFDGQRENATFRGWLWTVARSRIIEYHRRQKGRRLAAGGSSAAVELQSIVQPLPIDDPTEPDHASALLHRALEQIRVEFNTRTWDFFWRSTVLDHPTALIAQENGVTVAAVRQAKSRVLRRLRKQLGDV
jgi:RNA polymerase sigma-70 factor (ECF subfamily)